MNSPADSIAAYIRAKDWNRPHLIDAAFAPGVELAMTVRTNAIAFPSATSGRDALADTLVRRFNQAYENIYTFCIGGQPAPDARSFSCRWLVAMSDKEFRVARAGCGRYDWTFAPGDFRVTRLAIRIDAMEVLLATDLGPLMAAVAELPYPWCPERAALDALGGVPQSGAVGQALSKMD